MMIITAVIVSIMMMSVAASVSQLDEGDYTFRDEAYIANMIEREAETVDTRYTQERENFKKMVNSIEEYTTNVDYWYQEQCFNVTLSNRQSDINMRCIG